MRGHALILAEESEAKEQARRFVLSPSPNPSFSPGLGQLPAQGAWRVSP